MLLDGEHLVRAAHEGGVAVSILAISETAYAQPALRMLFEGVRADCRLLLADKLLEAVSPVSTPTGLVAAVGIPSPRAFPLAPENCLMLEGVQDPGNLGTMLRTAAAAGIRHVALSRGCASPWNPKVVRAGMGAHFRLVIHEQADLEGLARQFQGMVIATEPRAPRRLYDVALDGPVAWLFGNEGSGLSPDLLKCAHTRLCIPMPGPVESLNVSGALAICLFEQLRQSEAIPAVAPRA
jgi:TrmH family RNA methyltransferase